jgi:hypothetical protein
MPSELIQRQSDLLLDQAVTSLVARDWNAISEAARVVLGIDPDNEDALAFIAMAESTVSTPSTGSVAPESPNASSAPVASEPDSCAGGRHIMQRFLGEGGKKRVYLAHDVLLARDVAFALIKTEGFAEVAERSGEREQAMEHLDRAGELFSRHDAKLYLDQVLPKKAIFKA